MLEARLGCDAALRRELARAAQVAEAKGGVVEVGRLEEERRRLQVGVDDAQRVELREGAEELREVAGCLAACGMAWYVILIWYVP